MLVRAWRFKSSRPHQIKNKKPQKAVFMVPGVRIGLTTPGFSDPCSTTELPRQTNKILSYFSVGDNCMILGCAIRSPMGKGWWAVQDSNL